MATDAPTLTCSGPSPSLTVDDLSKSFGRLAVLDSFSYDFAPGRITALLGPNGAGKTTLLKCLIGLVRPDRGRITLDGVAEDGGGAHRRDIGFMPQLPRFPSHLTGRELTEMLDDLRGFTGAPDEDLVDALALREEMKKPFRTLSGGTRQKVNAAIAFRYRTPILVLDEPTAGLDPVASMALKEKIRARCDAGATVIITSHNLGDLEALAEDIVFLVEGRIRFAGPLPTLLKDTGRPTLEEAIADLMLRGGSQADSSRGTRARHLTLEAGGR